MDGTIQSATIRAICHDEVSPLSQPLRVLLTSDRGMGNAAAASTK
jgi:hypothetical protein